MFKIAVAGWLILMATFLRINQGSALTIAELTPQHSEEVIRQTKSEEILRYMNDTVDPCEDFYEFTCGNFAKYNPSDKQSISVGTILDKAKHQKVKDILQIADPQDSDVDRKVKDFYKSCLNLPKMKNVYGDKLKTVIEEFGSWPILQGDQWQESNFDWMKTLSQMFHKSAVEIIFSIEVITDLDDKTINRVAIGDPKLILPFRALYLDKSLSFAHNYLVDYVTNNLMMMGVEKELAQQAGQEIKDFEIALAHGITDEKLGLSTKERYSLTGIDQMQAKYGDFLDFKKLFNESLGQIPNELYVHNGHVENALKTVQNTPKRVVANYLFFNYLNNFFTHMTDDTNAMEQICMKHTKKYFYRNFDNMIYRKDITEQTKEDINGMWLEMKAVFRNTLESLKLNWIHVNTRMEALNKLDSMKMIINSYEDTNFYQEFDQMDLNDNDCISNIRSILMVRAKQLRAKICQTPQPADLGIVSSFTPLYIPVENTIYLPVSMLQPYYIWSTSYPNAYNFASLGTFVAHELIHGFDDRGRKYDSKGNERNWWDTESDQNFHERTKCFIDQYKQYSYGGISLPETPKQAENIADNGGIRLAYEAYLTWYDKAEQANQIFDSETFPGLQFNNRQLFFISNGHMWCTADEPASLALQLAGGLHVPGKYRLIGPLSNFNEFSGAFNCRKGSGMNPINKCEIY